VGVTRLTAGGAVVEVDRAHGGRLASLLVDGHELLVGPVPGDPRVPTDPLLWGCYPMAPWAGRTRGGRWVWGETLHELTPNHAGHAMHGTVFDRRWLLELQEGTYVRLRTELRPGWPYAGWVVHEVALAPDRVELRLEVHTESETFPAVCGWHPWFRRLLDVGEQVQIDLDAKRWYPRDVDGLPLGRVEPIPLRRGPWDDCFAAVTWPVTLTWPGAITAEITSTCDHVVRYDQPRHAVCIEPQTGPPDALNHPDLATIVRPGRPLVAEMSIAWTLPPS
jgi:aldose 1-epimerase